MKPLLAFLLALPVFTLGSLAQSKLPAFEANVIEQEDPEMIEEWGAGCSFYCADFSVTARSSSSLPHRNRLRYGAGEAHDFDLKTAWVEGSEGDGVGEFLEYTIYTEGSNLRVTGLIIFNGYRKNKELWQDNSRVKRLKMYVDGKPHGVINLKDAFNYQTLDVGSVELKPKKKTTLRFEIMEVYKGMKYSDTAIAEIELEGCCTH
jgi:hypothetical protein